MQSQNARETLTNSSSINLVLGRVLRGLISCNYPSEPVLFLTSDEKDLQNPSRAESIFSLLQQQLPYIYWEKYNKKSKNICQSEERRGIRILGIDRWNDVGIRWAGAKFATEKSADAFAYFFEFRGVDEEVGLIVDSVQEKDDHSTLVGMDEVADAEWDQHEHQREHRAQPHRRRHSLRPFLLGSECVVRRSFVVLQ